MTQSLIPSARARRRTKHSAASLRWPGAPLAFLLTGFTWLAASFLLGIALIIGLVNGTPLPHGLKPVHVHGALIGGILQLTMGGLLVSLAGSYRRDAHTRPRSTLFLTFNGGTVGLLVGFWLGNMTVVGIAGLLLFGAICSLAKAAWRQFGTIAHDQAGAGWLFRIAFVALVAGLGAGAVMAFRVTGGSYAYARLAHIHLITLGFLSLAFIVALEQLLPALLGMPVATGRLTRVALWSLPAGFAVLLGAFLTSSVWLEIAVGCLLLAAVASCTSDLFAAWLKTTSRGTAATDHLLLGAFFLVLTTVAGLAMSANYLQNPPLLPIGSLHLMAYTHLAFIGFMTQVIYGGLSFFVPELLAMNRVQNTAKRETYRAQLDEIMNRWRTIQLAGLGLGTMALCVLASLTWSVPLGSPYVQSTVWAAAGLLAASLAVFTAKLAWAVGLRPSS